MQRAAVDGGAADDLVSRPGMRHQDGRRGALARREQQRAFRAVQRRRFLLGADDGRVGVARVEVLARPTLVVRDDLLRAVEYERRRLVDRCGEWDGVAAVRLSGMYEFGGRSLHTRSVWMRSPLAPITGSMNWWYASS